jgi:hypothetical protein
MLLVFLGGRNIDKDVVQVFETEVQIFQDIIYESLESLGSVPQTKEHEVNSKRPKDVEMTVF